MYLLESVQALYEQYNHDYYIADLTWPILFKF